MTLYVRRHLWVEILGVPFAVRLMQDVRRFSWTDFTAYSTYLQAILLGLSLVTLYVVIWSRGADTAPGAGRTWVATFVPLVAALIFQAVYINPEATYPWNQQALHLNGDARGAKLPLYHDLAQLPEIVLLGSSRAFTLPADYLGARLDRTVFNWSVEGGGPLDALTIAGYTAANQEPAPHVFVVEIDTLFHSASWQQRTPLNLLPYLPDRKTMGAALQAQSDNVLNYSTFAEASFTYLYLYKLDPNSKGSFRPDGTTYGDRPIVPWPYREALRVEAPVKRAELQCAGPNSAQTPLGKTYIEALVQAGLRNKFGVVFYISPLNWDFLRTVDLTEPAIANCLAGIDSYMGRLMRDHPNVRYLNLLDYRPLGGLREAGYVDSEHITAVAARQLVDVLLPDIHSALQWANGARNDR